MNLSHLLLGALATGALSLQLGASAPTIVEAAAKGNPNGFNLTFSEPVDPTTATNPANYSVNGGVAVTGASLLYGTNETTIVIHTTDITGTGPFTVTVNGVADQEQPANEIAPDSTALIRRSTGLILNRAYGSINGGQPLGGSLLADLTSISWRFPDHPDLIELRPELSIVPYRTNNYGSQLLGFLEVPETGEYRFFIAARDQGILYLSTDDTAENRRPIAGEPQFGPVGPRQYLEPGSRSYNSTGGTSYQAWIATHFSNRTSDDALINDSLSAHGPITLEAGRRYYIEAQVKSASYDWLDIAWQRPGDLAVTNGQPAIEGSYLAPAPGPTDGPVSVPGIGDNFPVPEGGRYILYSHVVGTMPYQYQWFRNTTPIADATNAVLNVPFVNMDDHGAEYRLRVRNAFSEALSAPAVLQIIPDTEAPTVVRAEGSHQFDRVVLTFSEPLDPATATDVNNYSITIVGTQTVLYILEADLRHLEAPYPLGRSQVVLRTTPQIPGVGYRVSMANLLDRAAPPKGLAEQPTYIEYTAWVLAPGFLHLEVFPSASAEQLDTFDFDALANVPAPLGFVARYVNSAEDSHNYPGLSRLLGRLIPAAAGNHTLGIYSLSSSRLFLDLTGTGHPLSLIASREGNGFPGAWNFEAGGSQISSPVAMTAGAGYRFELIHAPADSSVQAGVTWQAPGEAAPANDTPSRLSGSLIACYANPDAPVFQVSSQPQTQTVDEFVTVNFNASASASEWGESLSLPLLYQWQKNGIDIPDATNSTYTIPSVLAAAAGTYRCLFIVPGRILPSDEATLTVIPHPLPEPDVAYALPDRRKVIVRFTSRIGQEMATAPGVFTIPGLTIESVSIGSGLESVELTTSLQTAGQVYTVNIHSIFDFDGTPVEMPVAPVQLNFTGPVLMPGYVLREVYTNIFGSQVSDLTNHVSFPASPAISEYISGVDYSASSPIQNAGVRLSGWITPPNDGAFEFFLAGDFQTVLYLSTDADAANKIPIALEPEWSSHRDYTGFERRVNSQQNTFFPWIQGVPVNRSINVVGPLSLEASQSYYFEVLKKNTANDKVSLTLIQSGSAPPANDSPGISGSLIASYVSPDNRITITQQPQSITIPNPQQMGQFVVGAVPLIAGPLTYQWFRNGVQIPGAVGGSVTLQPGLPGSSIAVTCRISAPGAPDVFSEPAYFIVEPVAIHLGWTGELWQLHLPYIDGTYRIERATNFPPTGGWQFLQEVPGYQGGWQFEQEFPSEFFRVELREP